MSQEPKSIDTTSVPTSDLISRAVSFSASARSVPGHARGYVTPAVGLYVAPATGESRSTVLRAERYASSSAVVEQPPHIRLSWLRRRAAQTGLSSASAPTIVIWSWL